MNIEDQSHSPLNVKLIGPAVKSHRIPVDQFAFFTGQIQSAVQRIGLILSGRQTSIQPGRAPKKLAESCALDVVALNAGSLEVCFELHEHPTFPIDTLGIQAMDCLVEGMAKITDDGLDVSYPKGFDKGVLLALRETGKLLSQGINEIQYMRRNNGLKAVYNMSVHERIVNYIQSPVVNTCTIEGFLLMGDFKTGKLGCRIHPQTGPAINCTFGEEQRDAILAAMTCRVRALGEATILNNEMKKFKIADVEIVEFKSEAPSAIVDGADFFERKIEIDQLAQEQGVTTYPSFENLLGHFWPEEENADEFLQAVVSIPNKYCA